MRGLGLFLAGILVGSMVQAGAAQSSRGSMALNHVAISVPDLDAGISFYTKALGIKEAFTFRDNRGRPLSYLQAAFRQGGLSVQDPVESQRTGALILQATGPNGLAFELLEFGPDSLQRKIMNAWK